jgi:hypothetical protein
MATERSLRRNDLLSDQVNRVTVIVRGKMCEAHCPKGQYQARRFRSKIVSGVAMRAESRIKRLTTEVAASSIDNTDAVGRHVQREFAVDQPGRVSREDIKTTAQILRRRFVYFMCLRLLRPKYTSDVGGRRHRGAACFLFADGFDIFTIRLNGKN